ncbi:MAG: flagellar biosynthetic protein FliR [Candidatus Dactylopiibacterium carminicum]|uniref:Flagellar biosynthetic protein FliR n=1 Tax=Candidatus Dactylopiibacterium carminicum TaxID=857335 RepID=A0A272EWH2_9RHOO|nr:flagellar biosynthetic protein FliR [Candidatus Dactylopiibacterium carminicum]KAF7599978.1 flagellar biosynthetic protein FliR [Candidatus Dactylopiibacterium carminicum]PAS94441.1 MAG: flagellar biosynthetic protein FliR [Candidatus Dactylopiibacterium carminicum]PAS96399.1 MAG: flagellar biosynthetic protein FliR [Candidatus Dactylopiibacterium carminicum]PAS99980.1 MAG: flagellar biosynthetic protein FliR [Candidatus Dactylopiibacterium carminicum]
MNALFDQLLTTLIALWWPFCRTLAMFSMAPILGDNMVPVTIRVLLSAVLAFVMLPITQGGALIDPLSLHGVVATLEQVLIGFAIGLAFHLAMSVVTVLGHLISSQMGLMMAMLNDPMSGASSDVVSGLLYMLCILVFFAIDGHLVLAGVLGESFRAWPVGSGIQLLALNLVALNVAWVLSAAVLLALPVVFSALVVQMGFGFLNRVAPSFNLFSLGFSLVTLFGLLMLAQIVRLVPDHYIRLTHKVLQMLRQAMGS